MLLRGMPGTASRTWLRICARHGHSRCDHADLQATYACNLRTCPCRGHVQLGDALPGMENHTATPQAAREQQALRHGHGDQAVAVCDTCYDTRKRTTYLPSAALPQALSLRRGLGAFRRFSWR